MSNWRDFLVAEGGQWLSEHEVSFTGRPDPGPGAPQLSILAHQKLLEVTGPDTAKFLQGQLTCDLEALQQGAAGLGAHCNHKGRMIADFRIAACGAESCTLRLNHSTLAPLQQSLGKYVVFSKAQLQPAPDKCIIGLSGTGAGKRLGEIFGELPATAGTRTQGDGGTVIRLDDDRFECWLNPDAATSVLAPLLARCNLRDAEYWDLLDIRAGIGQVRGQTSEAFIPQLLNYQLIDGISFTKGCYTGQEVIARMQYRGKLKRHMYRMRLSGSDLPAPGSDLFAADGERSVGNVVIAARDGEKNIELLGVCTSEAAEAGSVYLDRAKQRQLELLSLPYAITNQ